jgi:hypothetical protein
MSIDRITNAQCPMHIAHALRSVVKDKKIKFSSIEYIILEGIVAQD